MQNYFLLRAPTVDGSWYSFDIGDGPMRLTDNTFVLLRRQPSPVMYCDVFRGDRETELFEGDVIFCDNCSWLVNYDRGFYAINEAYETKYLYELKDWKHIGVCGHDTTFPVPYSRRIHHKFCSTDVVFNMYDVQAVTDDGIEVIRYKSPITFANIHQECGAKFHNEKMYLGYAYGGNVVNLYGGRLGYEKDGKYYDMIKGGELVGYIPTAVRGS